MKQEDNYYVAVLLLARNCVDKVDRSIESILGQTFDNARVRIVAVDNFSEDGTYEKLVGYAARNLISVYRTRGEMNPSRLLQAALSFVRYVEFKYFLILNTGDELYPGCIEKCAATMEEYADIERRILIFETDVKDEGGDIESQVPIFSESCILLKREHYMEFFTTGLGHKVQCFYCAGVIGTTVAEFPFIVDYSDWFKKALFSFRVGCVYVRDSLACTSVPKYADDLYDLVLRLNLIKRLELTQGMMYAHESYEFLDGRNSQKKIYENLSFLALEYALAAIKRGEREVARKALLFAEMVNEDVTGTGFYTMLRDSMARGRLPEDAGQYRIPDKSIYPPDGAVVIP